MCGVCGCGGDEARISGPAHEHAHIHGHEHTHSHDHAHSHRHEHAHPVEEQSSDRGPAELMILEQRILDKNDQIAEKNRALWTERGVFALNVMSAPGAGKTSLLERAVRELRAPSAVIEGDQESTLDADRIRRAGAPVVQVNTGTGCHLEADMARDAAQRLELVTGSVLFIENVGNLVCPSLFDLGEHARVVLFSVTEGADKPIKYAHLFRRADVVLLTKIDLLPYVDFDEESALRAVRRARPDVAIFPISSRTGEGLGGFYEWVLGRLVGSSTRAPNSLLRP